MARIVLTGFDAKTAMELTLKLIHLNHQPENFTYDPGFQSAAEPDLIFLSGDDGRFQRTITSLKSRLPFTPVIVSSRTVDDSFWLAALEAGAADYCPVDVDPGNLAWMIDNALRGKTAGLKVYAGAA